MAKKKAHKGKHAPAKRAAPAPSQAEAGRPAAPESASELFVALVLAMIIFFRPLRDGMVYPLVNIYFIWATLLLFALVCARLLLRGEGLRARLPLGLFALFLVIAWGTGKWSVQYNNTYRQLFTWAGHFCLLLVVSSGLRSQRSIGIVFVAFAIAGFSEAIFSIVHLKYYLPLVREKVVLDPNVLAQYFSSAPDQAAEIIRRLNTNRAFGHQLSPNALAGLMVLCVPFAMGTSVHCALAFKRTLTEAPPHRRSDSAQRLKESAAVGVISWMALSVVIFAAYYFFYVVAYRDEAISLRPFRWLVYVGLVPLLISSALYVVARSRGLVACAWFAGAAAMPVVGVLTFASLFYSYSRGGMLAFVTSTAATGALLLWILRFHGRLPSFPRKTAAALLAVALMASMALLGGQILGETAVAGEQELNTEGIEMSTKELMSGATAKLRISYWLTGLRMARDNFWCGVGLGNFGAMYPKYQYLGAGDTKQAHNDYLQVLCETGLFGALAFCAFWGSIILWTARQLHANRRPDQLWLVAGVFGSLLAFLLHAAVDFDFFNPSLTTFAIFLAGMLFVLCRTPGNTSPKSPVSRVVAIPLLLLAAVTMGTTWRVYNADVLAGTEQQFRTRMQTAQIFLFQLDPATYDPNKPSVLPQVAEAQTLIHDFDSLASFATFWEVKANGSARRLAPGEAIPPDARVNITDPVRAQEAALEAVLEYLEIFEHADGVFPHVPERASQLAAAYDLLADYGDDPETRKSYYDQAVLWAATALERSPEQAAFHEGHGRALWRRAGFGQDPAKQLEDMTAGLEEYKQATVLFSTSHHLWKDYGQALAGMGKALKKQGEDAKGQALIDQSAEALTEAKRIEREIWLANERRAGLR